MVSTSGEFLSVIDTKFNNEIKLVWVQVEIYTLDNLLFYR